MCPEIQPPATYWAEDDERAIAAHKGILYRIIIDGNPFNIVRNRGFLLDKYLTSPSLKVHGPQWYADKLDKVRLLSVFILLFGSS